MIEIPLGQWLPDHPTYKNPGCEVADNVIPTTGGYGPFPSPVGQSQTVSDTVYGAQQFFDNSGSSVIVGGTVDSLFIRRSTITETSGLSSIGTNEAWDFARFNDFVIATAAGNSPQYLTDIDSDNTWSALTGSPPTAKRVAKVGDFLMMGNITGAPNRIQWSAINDPAGSWASSRRTQAGQVDLDPKFGDVQRIVGGRYALVFQERGISRLDYVGPPQVWANRIISDGRGAVAPFSVVNIGYLTWFLSQDGWYVTNGTEVQPIGSQRVNRWFFAAADDDYLGTVQGAIDWVNECLVWSFVNRGETGYGCQLVYSWAQDAFSTAGNTVDWIVGSQTAGIDLDSLDAIYGNLDAIPLSLDATAFKPGARTLGGFIATEYSTFDGTPLAAQWDTGEFQPSPGRRVHVSAVRPVMDVTDWDMTAQLILRDNRGAVTYSNQATAGWDGSCSVRGEGEKVAVRLRKPAGEWEKAQAIHVKYAPAGYR